VPRYLIQGDPVVTLSAGDGYLRNGAVIVDGSQIVEVGPAEVLGQHGPFERTLGSNNFIVMPGLVNAHWHGEDTYAKGVFDTIWEGANTWYHEDLGPTDPQDMYDNVLYSVLQCIKLGTTCVIDFYYGRPAMEHFAAEIALRGFIDAGWRAGMGIALRDRNIYVHEDNETFLSRVPPDLAHRVRQSPVGYAFPIEDVLAATDYLAEKFDRHEDRVRIMFAPDWTPACSDELLRRVQCLAGERDAMITMHVVETRYEALFNIKNHGKTAAVRLRDIGFLGPNVSCAHFVWATDDDIKALAETGATAVNNPGSNLRLTSGISRVRDIMAAGGKVALGNDGISFNDDNDEFVELRLSGALQRPHGITSGRLPSKDLLTNACFHGAQAAGFGDRVGRLEPGKLADILLLEKDRIFFMPERYAASNPLDVIVDRAQGKDVHTVLINGRLVVDGRHVTVVDEEKLRQKVLASAERIFSPSAIGRQWRETTEAFYPYVIDFYKNWDDVTLPPGYRYNTSALPADEHARLIREQLAD
jgi:5-methylthioadenosine/S-adenosylhomocysteine deaminase